jgi:molybdopterin biosynthesis enzyme
LDDIFDAIGLIENYLPKPKFTLKKTSSLKYNDFINDQIILKENIPPFNQSAMDGIGVTSIQETYKLKGKALLDKYIDYKLQINECIIGQNRLSHT